MYIHSESIDSTVYGERLQLIRIGPCVFPCHTCLFVLLQSCIFEPMSHELEIKTLNLVEVKLCIKGEEITLLRGRHIYLLPPKQTKLHVITTTLSLPCLDRMLFLVRVIKLHCDLSPLLKHQSGS